MNTLAEFLYKVVPKTYNLVQKNPMYGHKVAKHGIELIQERF